ncbi:MAG: dockerin type I domain-containing protein, partial [Planctomycetota bacterium]
MKRFANNPRHARRLRAEALEARQLLAGDLGAHGHNPDVNRDGNLTTLDALVVLNSLERHGDDHPIDDSNQTLDVNLDGRLSLRDALIVVNQLHELEDPQSVRGFRYCEVIAVYVDAQNPRTEVWGTQGLNACPVEVWEAVDFDVVKDELGASAVIVNGPRYWLSDDLQSQGEPNAGPVRELDGLPMRQIASIEVTSDLTQGTPPYTPQTVNRNSFSTYRAGSEVYELTSPTGDVYIMQSYTEMVDPTLSQADLPNLGSRLSLPDGWTYSSRITTKPIEIRVEDSIQVLTDDFQNAYSRLAQDSDTNGITFEETFTIDNTAPTVAISRHSPNTEVTNADSVAFFLDFSEDVRHVTAEDFEVAVDGVTAGAITVHDADDNDDSTYVVSIGEITGDGVLDLDFASGQDITDLAGNAFASPGGDVTGDPDDGEARIGFEILQVVSPNEIVTWAISIGPG